MKNLSQLKNWRQLAIDESGLDIEEPYSDDIKLGEIIIAGNSPLVGKTLNSIGFRGRFEANVLAICRSDRIRRTNLQDIPLQQGDVLLIAGHHQQLVEFENISGIEQFRFVSRSELIDSYHLHERLMIMTVPPDSAMIGKTLRESRLGESLGSRVLGILRGDDPILMPEPWEAKGGGPGLRPLVR